MHPFIVQALAAARIQDLRGQAAAAALARTARRRRSAPALRCRPTSPACPAGAGAGPGSVLGGEPGKLVVLPVTPGRPGSRPRVLLLGGSLARPSHTSALLAELEHELAGRGAVVCRWDLGERPLPFADPAYHHRPLQHPCPAVRQLAAAAAAARALVLGSPLYHNSYSALLKNALDLLPAAAVAGKPVGLVSHAGQLPSTQALDHLRLVARGLHGVAIVTQVATIDTDYTITRGGTLRLSGAAAHDRLRQLAGELLWYADRLGQGNGPAPGPGDDLEAWCVSG